MEIHLAVLPRQKVKLFEEVPNLVTPGDIITSDSDFMRGHGTYTQEGTLHASVAGKIDRVNKLVCVSPLKTRYNGEIGDVVVGRVVEISGKRWKIDTHSKLNSILHLSSVNLPGGELRRRSEEDERLMREYLKEGDLISAEVQNVMSDGSLFLHTRSLKYGKLDQGVIVEVSPSLVLRRKTHFHNLPCGASVIFGNNGNVWVCPTINEDTANTGGFVQDQEPVSHSDREVITRLRNCVVALAAHSHLLYDTSLLYAYEASLKYSVKELLKYDVAAEVVELTRNRFEMQS